MRALFGGLTLVIVLAIVGMAAKKQLQALRLAPAVPMAQASAPRLTVPEQSQQIQQSIRQEVTRALGQQEQRAAKAGEE